MVEIRDDSPDLLALFGDVSTVAEVCVGTLKHYSLYDIWHRNTRCHMTTCIYNIRGPSLRLRDHYNCMRLIFPDPVCLFVMEYSSTLYV